jgi:hypothetical protein
VAEVERRIDSAARYHCTCADDPDDIMRAAQDGAWVRHSDLSAPPAATQPEVCATCRRPLADAERRSVCAACYPERLTADRDAAAKK